jgi:hypothetical protein
MRKDMAKVIVERPRGGHADGYVRGGRTRVILDDDGEPLRAREPARTREVRTKGLNENLSPLKRYLASQVGRPWNKVYSEISVHLRPSSTVQQHVRDHLDDFVATKTRMVDGRVFTHRRFSAVIPVDEDGCLFYVHPRTGLLKRNEKRRSYVQRRKQDAAKAAAERAARMRELDGAKQAHCFDGVWWEITLASQPMSGPFEDVVRAAGLSTLPTRALYGREGVYATAKRVFSKAEKKALGLS